MKKPPTPVSSLGDTDPSITREASDSPETKRESSLPPPPPPPPPPTASKPRPHGPISEAELASQAVAGRAGYCMSCGAFQSGILPDQRNVSNCGVCTLNAVVGLKHAIDTGILIVT